MEESGFKRLSLAFVGSMERCDGGKRGVREVVAGRGAARRREVVDTGEAKG